jgi:hypothetical protein
LIAQGAKSSKLFGLKGKMNMDFKNLIAIAGIFVTLAISMANLVYSIVNNRKTIFVNTVTTSRLKWISSLRDKVSEYIAVSAQFAGPKENLGDPGALSLRRDTLHHQIALHLNPRDPEDQKILQLTDHVSELIANNKIDKLPTTTLMLRKATADYLKKEWNRVKKESGGTHVDSN